MTVQSYLTLVRTKGCQAGGYLFLLLVNLRPWGRDRRDSTQFPYLSQDEGVPGRWVSVPVVGEPQTLGQTQAGQGLGVEV